MSVTMRINAAPDAIYSLVTDLPRMGEWSPENTGGEWLKGATKAAPGAKFKGTNANGENSWSTTATVVEAIPGESFVFDIAVGPFKVARWSYRIAPAGGGCDVTEQWLDHRSRVAKRFSGGDRTKFTETSIRTTLENLKATAEA